MLISQELGEKIGSKASRGGKNLTIFNELLCCLLYQSEA